jgi:hypothetical protein
VEEQSLRRDFHVCPLEEISVNFHNFVIDGAVNFLVQKFQSLQDRPMEIPQLDISRQFRRQSFQRDISSRKATQSDILTTVLNILEPAIVPDKEKIPSV